MYRTNQVLMATGKPATPEQRIAYLWWLVNAHRTGQPSAAWTLAQQLDSGALPAAVEERVGTPLYWYSVARRLGQASDERLSVRIVKSAEARCRNRPAHVEARQSCDECVEDHIEVAKARSGAQGMLDDTVAGIARTTRER